MILYHMLSSMHDKSELKPDEIQWDNTTLLTTQNEMKITECVGGRDTFENVPIALEHFVDIKRMTNMNETSYGTLVLPAISVTL